MKKIILTLLVAGIVTSGCSMSHDNGPFRYRETAGFFGASVITSRLSRRRGRTVEKAVHVTHHEGPVGVIKAAVSGAVGHIAGASIAAKAIRSAARTNANGNPSTVIVNNNSARARSKAVAEIGVTID